MRTTIKSSKPLPYTCFGLVILLFIGAMAVTIYYIIKETQEDLTMSTYYTETYRPQYHITPERGWLNDPNGLVYYNGEYHVFYQYYPDSKFPGDMKYWAHVASTDLVHWEQRPVALSPDKYGSIWSGSVIADINNDSGLFTDTKSQSGLIAFYTVFSNGIQQQAIAYSKDCGNTWEKYRDGIPVIRTSDDPLNNGDFRDPKVFWHEESQQWMMVIAGGPLRFYSSTDLLHWTPEAMQREIHTECPDFFKMKVEGEETEKWILSGGGVWYMIGDFQQINGIWTFVPDSDTRYPFNYGPDVYASQTFYGTEGRRLMISWMVNISYPFETGQITDPWNGALTLPYTLSLKKINGQLRLSSNPVEELSILRQASYSGENIEVSSENPCNPFAHLQLKQYEMELVVDMGTATEFGLHLRVGNNQYTAIEYNTNTGRLCVDRAFAGANPVDPFASAYSAAVPLEDGKLKLHFYVDWSSVELFAQEGNYPFTLLIYPDDKAVGLDCYAKGGTATITEYHIYELSSIYRTEEEDGFLQKTGASQKVTSIELICSNTTLEQGETSTVWAVTEPLFAGKTKNTIHWTITGNLEVVAQGDTYVTVKATDNGSGNAAGRVQASLSGTNPGTLLQTLQFTIAQSNFRSNLSHWSAWGGSWHLTENGLWGSGSGNSPLLFAQSARDFIYEGTFTYTKGNIGTALIFRAASDLSVFYTVDLCEANKNARILKFHRDPITGSSSDITLGEPYTITLREDHTYTLRIEAKGNSLKLYVNDQLAVETTDSESLSGYFGLNLCDAAGYFQDLTYTEIQE